jgi:hypothetical protein
MCFPRLRTRRRGSPPTVSLGVVPPFDVTTRSDPIIGTPTVQFFETEASPPKNRKHLLLPSSPSSASAKRSQHSNLDLKNVDEFVGNAQRGDQRSGHPGVLLDGDGGTADSSDSKEDIIVCVSVHAISSLSQPPFLVVPRENGRWHPWGNAQ